MRVVLDTNVLIAAFISEHGSPARILQYWRNGEFDLVTSSWQIEEFRRASRYGRIKERVTPSHVGAFVNALRRNALVLERLPNIDLSPDPDDNAILAAAIAGEAQYVVSGDKGDLLALETIEGVSIVTARAFVELFG